MPVLDRQADRREPILPPSLQGLPPRSVPRSGRRPLQRHYINLSVVALVAAPSRSPRSSSARRSPARSSSCASSSPRRSFVLTTADAALRFWRARGPGCRSTAGAACSGWPGWSSLTVVLGVVLAVSSLRSCLTAGWTASEPRARRAVDRHRRRAAASPALARGDRSTTAPAAGPRCVSGRSTASTRHRLGVPDCGHIAYVNPRLVVTTIPVTDAGEVVLLRRGFEPGRGWWAQPGGFLEVDETVHRGGGPGDLEETGLHRGAGRDHRPVRPARGRRGGARLRGADRRRRAPADARGPRDPGVRPDGDPVGRDRVPDDVCGRSSTGSRGDARTSRRRGAGPAWRRRARG